MCRARPPGRSPCNGGNFELTYAAPLTLAESSPFNNTGTFGIHNNTSVTIDGGFTNSGTLGVDSAYLTHDNNISYSEGGSSLTIKGTLANTGSVQIGDEYITIFGTAQYGLNAATTVTLGGLTNSASTDTFVLDGSSSFAATLSFTGSGFTSNGGNFELTYAAPLTLAESSPFNNTGTFGIHNNSVGHHRWRVHQQRDAGRRQRLPHTRQQHLLFGGRQQPNDQRHAGQHRQRSDRRRVYHHLRHRSVRAERSDDSYAWRAHQQRQHRHLRAGRFVELCGDAGFTGSGFTSNGGNF